ncbi:aminotransferase class III-fold pyridoxal phosphate-dependent enzyme [Xenorhabdus hominickii]|uniref:2,4-diaminobutyrate 4-transaminase n=1 Tax=Xenorhabdus hominickii TaxID=351679 RepID=A0A1V0M4C7_XENHO|nr:aminotransferase class III-fold pyridoxal phosphate-dependent enzyme [Xenorhabdus hominickii]ARD69718.1 Putrescine aminotransferase [Xenorhabdus hominickii]PHM51663.1 2,4-diaminobutyrate 4-transaminase [Xenorhabdus hominickii]
MEKYATFCRPQLTRALISMGLNRTYHRAAGNFLYYYDENDKETPVLDLLGGYGATLFGHNSPVIREKIKQYLDEEIPIHNQFSIKKSSALLAERLNELLKEETGAKSNFIFFFASTGAESIEIALKNAEFTRHTQLEALEQEVLTAIARISDDHKISLTEEQRQLLQLEKEASIDEIKSALITFTRHQLGKKAVFLALEHSFHGKTIMTASCTNGAMYRDYLKRIKIDTHFLSAKELSEFADMGEKANDFFNSWLWLPQEENNQIIFTKKPFRVVTAFLVEPVQGEGGVHPLSAEQVSGINRLKQTLGCPVIADEVQSGSGRCGFLVASSDTGLDADYYVLSKAMGAGYVKIGVVAISQESFTPGFDVIQSSTFGEDDFSCRVALDYLNLIHADQRRLLKQVTHLGEVFRTELNALKELYPDVIRDVRGKGLIWGIEFYDVMNSDSYIMQNIAVQGILGYIISGHLLCGSHIRVAPTASAANVVRIEPSVFLNVKQIQSLITALSGVCLAIRHADTGFIIAPLLGKKDLTLSTDYRRVASPQYENSEADYKVAFINHLISASGLREVDPSFSIFSDRELELFVESSTFKLSTKPFKAARIRSINGKSVEFTLYPLIITSKMIKKALDENDLERLRYEIDTRVTQAASEGNIAVGLGMFTSIITNNGKSLKNPPISVTTGNALTVGIGVEALQKSIAGRNMADMRIAVVGGAGNIGSVYAEILGPRFREIVLIGSSNHGSLKKLDGVKYRIYQNIYEQFIVNRAVNRKPVTGELVQRIVDSLAAIPADYLTNQTNVGMAIDNYLNQNYPTQTFIHTSQNISDIENCDVIVCASNASEAFLSVEKIKNEAIICDISVPHNLSDEDVLKRPDLKILRGGIVQTPHHDSLDPRVRAYLKEGQIYACMAETLLLGLEEHQGNFSYGNISANQVIDIITIAEKHHFSLSDIKESSSL